MRKERVAAEIKKEISTILANDIRDPRLGFLTITRVEISADLKFAKIFFSVLGDAEQNKRSQKILENAKGFIRKLIADRLELRSNPEITFRLDKSIAYSVHIEEKINQLKAQGRDKSEETGSDND